ncbi:MAG: nitrilase-related carbon-nitrogen hydrolase [Candidatus Hodarchaeota archaeon]
MVRLAVAQMEPHVGEAERNLSEMKRILIRAQNDKVDVLVLPELLNSGYVFENTSEVDSLSETIPDGLFSKELLDWSKRNRLVVAGLSEKTEVGLFNSAAAFGNGEYITTYRKIHLFGKENEWFQKGTQEPPVFEYDGHRYGLMICFDWAFPETARILALKGAQVILHPTNLVLDLCPKAMVTRSIENRLFTASSGRIGTERGMTFKGGSQITDPRGNVLLRFREDELGVLWTDINPKDADDKLITEHNDVIGDRKPELYGELTKGSK